MQHRYFKKFSSKEFK